MHRDKPHAFIAKVTDHCESSCHLDLSKLLSEERYTVLNEEYGQIVSSLSDIESLFTSSQWIQSYIPMTPELKIDANLDIIMSSCPSRHATERITLHVSISALSSSSLSQFIQRMAEWSQRKESSGESEVKVDTSGLEQEASRMMTVSTTCGDLSSVVDDLTNQPEVLWVEERLKAVKHNRWARGICQSGAPEKTPLYYANITGRNQIIGVSDTGLDMSSGYFWDPLVPPPYNTVNDTHRKVVTYITTNGDKTDDDKEAHGTHVCGTAAGKSYRDYGDYKAYNGAAYDSKIAFFDMSRTSTSGALQPPNDIDTQLLKRLHDAGARIISNSWGNSNSAGSNAYTGDARRVDAFMHREKETLVIFSAGNEGARGDYSVSSPSTNKNGLCAGMSLNDHDNFLAYGWKTAATVFQMNAVGFNSSRGPTADDRLKPDLLAPGWFITSASGTSNPNTTLEDLHYQVKGLSGTSMSAPMLAGQAALVREYFTSGFYPTGSKVSEDSLLPSGALLKAMLIHSGQPVANMVNKAGTVYSVGAYPSSLQGYGRVQIDKVLHFGWSRVSPISLFVVGSADASSSHYRELSAVGQIHTYTVVTSATTSMLRVTLAYTDTVGTVGSANILVNDLDVTLWPTSDPSTQHLPLLSNAHSRKNNVEQIILNNPAPNTNYTIEVRAHFIATVQAYALVIIGDVKSYNDTETQGFGSGRSIGMSAVNQGVLAVLTIACTFLLLTVVCVSFFNRRPHDPDGESYSLNPGNSSPGVES